MLNYIKKYFPLIILITSCILYSLHYSSRLVVPHFDETIYASGNFKLYADWGPLYVFFYYVLNFFTHDPFMSMFYNFFVLTFIAIPLATYITLRNLKFNIQNSSLAAIISLLAYWNFPSDPKVQLFNYLIVLLAFNIRWKFSKIAFYFLLSAAIYIRQDNIILIAVALCWDFYYFSKKKDILLPILTVLLTFISLKFLLGNTFTGSRSVDIFLDHFGINNGHIFAEYTKANIPLKPLLETYFNHPKNLLDIFAARPIEMGQHILKNIPLFFSKISLLFSMSLDRQWNFSIILKLFFIVMTLKVLLYSARKERLKEMPFKELQLFSLCLLVKCLSISILLNWWVKYFFELFIIVWIWISLLMTSLKFKYIQNKKLKEKLPLLTNILWVMLPFLFFLHRYYINDNRIEKNLPQLIKQVRVESQKNPINSLISTDSLKVWPGLNPRQFYNIYFDRSFDREIHSDLKSFLHNHQVDTIIVLDELRRQLKEVGFEKEFSDFEKNYKFYGYVISYKNEKNQIIYRLQR